MKAADPPFDEIVRRIVEHVQPRRVVLFGSHSRGDARRESDVDLMVEVEDVPDWKDASAIRGEVDSGIGCSLDLLFFTPSEIVAQCDDPGSVLFDIVLEGRELYVRRDVRHGDSEVSLVPPASNARTAFPESAADSVRSAADDLVAIDCLLAGSETPWDTVCSHAQLTAEKYLRALLLRRWLTPEGTHDLTALLAACRAAGDSLPGIDADCEMLSRYAEEGGHAGQAAGEPEGTLAVAAARQIVAATWPRLQVGGIGRDGKPDSADPPLDEIVSRIVAQVHPRRIVLFGSRARGEARWDSDVDLMVELETELSLSERRGAIYDLFHGRDWSFDLLVYTPEEVAAQRDDPGCILFRIEREGRVLYRRFDSADAADHRVPSAVRERPPLPPSLDELVRLADEDLLNIENNLAGSAVPWGTISFHAQQAAEKYLKALLVCRWKEPGRTHNISNILAECRAAGDALPGLDEDCELLSRYAVESRYKLAVQEAEAGVAVVAAQRIVAAARAILASKRP